MQKTLGPVNFWPAELSDNRRLLLGAVMFYTVGGSMNTLQSKLEKNVSYRKHLHEITVSILHAAY